jgi:hypothetical protein
MDGRNLSDVHCLGSHRARHLPAPCQIARGHADLLVAVQAEAVVREWPEFSLKRFARKEPLRREEDRMRLVEAMRLARLPE